MVTVAFASKLAECYGVSVDDIKSISISTRKTGGGVEVCVVRLGALMSLIGVEQLHYGKL